MSSIKIHCMKCRKWLKMTYTPTGNRNALVMQGLEMNCPFCHNKYPRTISFHESEAEFVSAVSNGKYFI